MLLCNSNPFNNNTIDIIKEKLIPQIMIIIMYENSILEL